MKELRPAIIRMHQRGTAKREIARLLGIGESTVRKAIQRHEETAPTKTSLEEEEKRPRGIRETSKESKG